MSGTASIEGQEFYWGQDSGGPGEEDRGRGPPKDQETRGPRSRGTTKKSPQKLFFFELPHLRDLDLGTPGSRWGWALQADCGVRHSRETLGLGTLWGWAGHSRVGHSRETLAGLGTPGSLWGWAFQGVYWGWALQGVSGVGHSRESLGVDRARRSSGRGEELSLKSNNPTPKVGKIDLLKRKVGITNGFGLQM